MAHGRWALVLATWLALTCPAVADDLTTGTEQYLCSATTAVGCVDGVGNCFEVALRDFNVPRFVEVDLDERLLRTTEASGLNRVTEIKNPERQDGLLILQGAQLERAFSVVISEKTGDLSWGVVTDGVGVVIFGVCTPLPSRE